MLKVVHNSSSSETVLLNSFKIILLLFEFLFEKSGATIPRKALLSHTFLVSKILKYYFLGGS